MSSLILVIDDEREILDMIAQDLTNQGYEVITADRGEAAISAFQTMFPRPDLALVDVVMPGMSGPMVVDRLRELEVSLPVLFMSGFHERQVVQRFVLEEGFRMILKPFTLKELRDAVKAAIESGPRPQPEKFIH